MVDIVKQPGRLRRAPENFLSEAEVKAVGEGRRDFLRKSFLTAAGAAMTAPMLARASEGDANILQNPEWTTTLGQPVAVRPTGYRQNTKASWFAVSRPVLPGLARRRFPLPPCKACSASLPRRACISSAITRVGTTLIRPGTA